MTTHDATDTREDLGAVFARHVVQTEFSSLSPKAVEAAKQSTLDTIGVILGASGIVEAMKGVDELYKGWGGAPESTVLGFGGKLPAPAAAFVNGAMAHGLDFDDHLPEGHHPSSSLVPGLLAMSERLGGVSGEAFITAVAIGQDLFARIRRNVAWKQDWFMTPVLGAFSTAAACAKLLGLDERQTLSALGIASMYSAGTMQLAYGTGGELRGMYAAFGAKGGVEAALLAQVGVTGTTAPFEGKAGFLEVYFDNEYDRDAMLEGLGTDYQGASILYKLWPSCGASHGYIDTALRLLGSAGRGDEIERLEVIGGDFAEKLSTPIEDRRRPPSSVDAKFSIPYTVALAIATGTVGITDFSDERRADPAVGAIADRITFVRDAKYDWTEELPATAVRITLKGGEVLEGETSHAETKGSVDNPLDWDEIEAKFRNCAAASVSPRSDADIAEVVAMVRDLERLDDVSALAAAVA